MYQTQTLPNNTNNKNQEFSNNKNKALLWNLMYEGGVFKKIPSQYLENVKTEFEKKIIKINSNVSTLSLIQLNKQIISEMITDLNKYRVLDNISQPVDNKKLKTGENIEPITAQEVSNKKIKQFNNNLERKQNEFDEMLKQNQPNEIDFSDNLDKPIGSEINSMLEAAISKRENELNIVLDKQNATEAEDWINKDNDNKEKQVSFALQTHQPQQKQPQQQPDQPQQQPPQQTPQQQPHRQQEQPPQEKSMDSFLSKLKKVDHSDNNYIKDEFNKINNRLTFIETTQREVLEFIAKFIKEMTNNMLI